MNQKPLTHYSDIKSRAAAAATRAILEDLYKIPRVDQPPPSASPRVCMARPGAMTTCSAAECPRDQERCLNYRKASYFARCMHLRDGEYCTA